MTVKGDIKVEDLAAGDRIITRAGGLCYLRATLKRRARLRPIRIAGGSLGHSRPGTDVTVSPATRLHIRDWRAQAMFGRTTADIRADRLVDGEFLRQQPACDMDVYDLVFDEPQIVMADGIEILIGKSDMPALISR